MKIQDLLKEAGSVGATVSGNIPSVANPSMARKKIKKQTAGSNALDSNLGLMTGAVIKR